MKFWNSKKETFWNIIFSQFSLCGKLIQFDFVLNQNGHRFWNVKSSQEIETSTFLPALVKVPCAIFFDLSVYGLDLCS